MTESSPSSPSSASQAPSPSTAPASPAPRVTIGLPVYNGERYLAAAVQSLLEQTFTDFELVISDNASTDRTEEICRSHAGRDPRVIYVRQHENRGAAWNFNHVFELARGAYFKWAADDDIYAPTYLAECVQVLDDCPEVAWCHSQTVLIGADGRPLDGPAGSILSYAAPTGAAGGPSTAPTRESEEPHRRFRAVLLGSRSNRDVFGLTRTDLLRTTALQLPIYGADKICVAELALRGRFREIRRPLYFGRVHAGASGALRSAADQRRWVAGNHGPRPASPIRLALVRGYWQAIRRADISAGERARCAMVLVRYLFQITKWPHVVARALSGRGTGGGYLNALKGREER